VNRLEEVKASDITVQQEALQMTAPQDTKPRRAAAQRRAPVALVALHLVQESKDKKATFIPIGTAIAHDDGEGYTLRLDLMPTGNGQIILRRPNPRDGGVKVPTDQKTH
jgi:hypothetical protein